MNMKTSDGYLPEDKCHGQFSWKSKKNIRKRKWQDPYLFTVAVKNNFKILFITVPSNFSISIEKLILEKLIYTFYIITYCSYIIFFKNVTRMLFFNTKIYIVNFPQSQFETMRGVYFIFYSDEPTYKITYYLFIKNLSYF